MERYIQTRTASLPAGGIPVEVSAYWDAYKRYYATEGVTRPPRNVDMAAVYRPRINVRTFDRRKKELRGKGKLGKYDWLEGCWPPPADWRPSWLPLLEQQQAQTRTSEDGLLRLVVEETYDKDGRQIDRRILRTLGHLGTLAAAFAYSVFDMSDGRLDGVFRAVRFSRLVLDEVWSILCHGVA